MLTRSLPRFLLQAGLLIAAAAISAVAHLTPLAIVLVMAGGFVVVVIVEWLITREAGERSAKPTASRVADTVPSPMPRRSSADPARAKAAPLLRPPGADVRPAPPQQQPPPPSRAPVRPRPRPAPAVTAAVPPVPVPSRPAPRPEPPRAPARPVVPPRPPTVEPVVQPPPLPPRPTPPPPVAAPPPPAPVGASPPVAPPAPPPTIPPPPPVAPPVVERRSWNVFDLQNRARQIAGRDVARDEELSFLLLYLREFADVGGDLSEEFDAFVRESFGDLITQ